MWNLWIIEIDHYVDSKTGQHKSEEVDRYYMKEVEDLTNFLINIKKDIKRNPEFFCPACGFWTSYQLIIEDSRKRVVDMKNLSNLFMNNEDFDWDFSTITLEQLQEILAKGMT